MSGLSSPTSAFDSHEHAIRPACSWLLLSALLLFTVSVAIWSTGGFVTSVAGIRVSARTPAASALGGLVVTGMWLLCARRRRAVRTGLRWLWAMLERHGVRGAALVAVLTTSVAVRFHTFSASGADASGYLSEARMLSAGLLEYAEPLATAADWNDAARTLAPLGWQAATAPAQVPTYAVGLPLLMVVPHMLGGAIGASLVVAVSAGLSVWFAARLASSVGGGVAAIISAVAVATIPVHLFQSMQPMSDVPVTAAWLACWWWMSSNVITGAGPVAGNAIRAREPVRAMLAGIAAGLAVLIRPNLAPLAAVPALYIWFHWPTRRRAAATTFALPVAVAGVVVGYLQWRWFGSPFRSGYGSAPEIYSLGNVAPNLRLYFDWLLETGGAWVLAAPLTLLVSAPGLRWLLAFALFVCAAYLIYGTFEAWPYLRFLLPALALAGALVAGGVARTLRLLPATSRAPLAIALVLAIGGVQLARARELGVFSIRERHSRAVLAGYFVQSAAPHHAVFLTGEQSGAVRYYTGRSIVRWDFLEASALPKLEEAMERHGRELWILLDDWEVALFRDKLGATPMGLLDWPPAIDAGTLGRIQAWRLRDRAPFLNGARIVTHRLR